MYLEFRSEVEEFLYKNGLKTDVKIVAVTKGVGLELIREVYREGCRDFGESRVQEAQEKIPHSGLRGVTWHMIGHLQRNKVNKALKLFNVIQSVDSFKLAEALSKRTKQPLRVFVEVNTSGEPGKHGVHPDQARDLIDYVRSLPNLILIGVMTVGPYPVEEVRSRRAFALLRRIAEENGLSYISAGMSEDWKYALLEGANVLRIGRAIFKRPS